MTSCASAGKTPLVRIDALCAKFGLPRLRCKDESKNPFGTWKDRRSELIVQKAKNECADKLCLITSGNAGFSLARFAGVSRIPIVPIVDAHLRASIKEALRRVCGNVVETDLSKKILKPEEVIALAREHDEETIWDVTNGFHGAYGSIIEEIRDEAPDYVVCPVGSGEGFVGLFDGLQKFKMKTKLIGVTAVSRPSYADKLHTPWTPYKAKIRSVLEAGHEIIRLEEDEIRSAYAYAQEHIACEPSSAAVIGALRGRIFKKGDAIVMVNSGKGLV